MSALGGSAAELSAWSATEGLQVERRAAAEPASASGACTCGLELSIGAYNEEAFQYLLTIEQKRFERTRRPFVLALIEQAASAGEPQPMDPAVAAKVVAALTRSLRETDMIGWYREGCVLGALLTHLGDGPAADASRIVSSKIARAMRDGLTERAAERLALKMYQSLEPSWS